MRSPRGIRVLEESVAELQVALETSRACTCTVRSVSLNKIIAVLSSRPYFNIFVPYHSFHDRVFDFAMFGDMHILSQKVSF